MRGLKIPMIVLAFAVVLVVGLGARAFYYQERVVAPLAGSAGRIAGVEEIEVVEAAGGLRDVRVLLSGDVKLEEAYARLERLARENLGPIFGRLVIEDRRSPRLVEAYYEVHFAIQEGISTGLFNRMAEEIDRRLAELEISRHRVFVGEEHVFIQLHEGDSYLYEVIPRSDFAPARSEPGRGGVAVW